MSSVLRVGECTRYEEVVVQKYAKLYKLVHYTVRLVLSINLLS
jgi:hypothetical protein